MNIKSLSVGLMGVCVLAYSSMAIASQEAASQPQVQPAGQSQVKSKSTTEHFTWGDVCDGWWLKDQGDFTIILESMPPHSTEKKHYHKETEQFFYVNEGTLFISLDDKTFLLKANEGIPVPAGVQHNLWNDSNEKVSFLVISGPKLKKDRVDL